MSTSFKLLDIGKLLSKIMVLNYTPSNPRQECLLLSLPTSHIFKLHNLFQSGLGEIAYNYGFNTRVLNHSSHCLLLEAPFTQTWETCRSLFPEVIINVWVHFVYVKHHLFCTLLVLGRKHVLTLEEARWQHRSNFKFIHICFELINNFRNYKNVIKRVWKIPAHPDCLSLNILSHLH